MSAEEFSSNQKLELETGAGSVAGALSVSIWVSSPFLHTAYAQIQMDSGLWSDGFICLEDGSISATYEFIHLYCKDDIVFARVLYAQGHHWVR